MPNFAKKCKRHIRRIFYSKVFSCVCLQDHKDPTTTAPQSQTTTDASEKLEILLLKTLKNQLEDRDYHDQLKTTLQHITKLLEQIGKNYEFHQKISQRFPNAGFSQLTISVSKDSLVRCQSEIERRSLVVVKGASEEDFNILENRCQSKIISVQSGSFPRGHFSSILCRAVIDKAIQFDSNASSFQTDSKLIQTQLLDLSNFHLTTFKINLIKHIRTLKEDVVTLRQLLFSVERYSIRDVAMYRNESTARLWRENEFDHKFFEAKIRAANFVKFYKLRSAGGGGKKKAVKGGVKERRVLLRKNV